MNALTTGVQNSAFGFEAMKNNTTGSYNTGVGVSSLFSSTTGANNTALGYYAMYYNTGGHNNTAVGGEALMSNTTGSNNVAVGYEALYSNDPGINNTALGYFALANSYNGNDNTAIGGEALANNNSGSFNTAVGRYALRNNFNPSNNTAVGHYALGGVNNGPGNTAIGTGAGYTGGVNAVTTGSANTFIGFNSGFGSATQRNNATAIGYNAKVDANNALVLGGTGTESVNVGIGTSNPTSILDIRAPFGKIPVIQLTSPSATAGVAGGMIDFFSFTGTVDQPQARIRATDDGNYSGDMVFFARNQGATFTSMQERMRIFSTGKIWMRTIQSNQNALLVFDSPSPTEMRMYTDAMAGTPADLILSTFPNATSNQLVLKQNTGNVGIGTTSPSTSHRLTIYNPSGAGALYLQTGSSSSQITMDDSGVNNVYLTSTLGAFDIWTGGNNQRMTVLTNGNVGINNTAPTAKLDVAGTFKLADGSQGTDKILTSDGLGNASWQNSSINTGFAAYSSVAQTINASTWTQISFSGEDFDDGNDFASNQYVAPTAGVYHFNASVSWTPMSNTTGYSFISLYKNGSAFKFRMTASHTNYHSNNISETMKLNAGDVITVWVAHFSTGGTATTYVASNLYTYFDGHRLY
jgi:hypothetical protein